jgi:hypothetical protein
VRDDPARRVAEQLERRGLGPIARLLLEAHLPLAPLLADVGAALGPLTGAIGTRPTEELVALAEEGHAMERLIAELDRLEERGAQPG